MTPPWAGVFPDSVFGVYEANGVIILQAVLDGSYGERTPCVFAYAGLAAATDIWRATGREWTETLEQYRVTTFSMAAAMNRRGEFFGWEEPIRDHFLDLLADVLVRSGMRPVGVSCDVGMLTQGSRATKARDLFEATVRALVPIIPSEAKLALICDREPDLAKLIIAWLDRIAVTDRPLSDRLAGVCFMNSRDIATLQAADMTAWLYRQYAEQRAINPLLPINPLLAKLTRGEMVYRHV